jgi:hypothetical protein
MTSAVSATAAYLQLISAVAGRAVKRSGDVGQTIAGDRKSAIAPEIH